ncbi:Putative Zn-dependent protease [Myxococcus hansupus]|uniref:Putative Zn-dependent protease n=1 Tax=Pseudomyxococcus hansupus TaxID=1297742 RepID=A0A0H4XMD3_9BACT|nr:M48 family metalloprotease [Myxococcus hansupus]AKQ69457.1 Putative Zn-dependent protease [Myxococcus hansupus]
MMRTGWKVLALVGLGALSASCKGFNAAGLTKGDNILGKLSTANTEAKQCTKLHADPSVKEEYALGGALAIHYVQRGHGLMLDGADDALHRYLNVVGKNLAAQSARPTLEWTFGVLDDTSQFNAMSAPGGYIFVTRKLLQGLENEGELAGVLAHEIAHVTLKHAIRQYGATKVKTCELVTYGEAMLAPAWVKALSAGRNGDGTLDLDNEPGLLGYLSEKTIELMEKGNSREQEFEADRIAVELMLSAGYDPQAYQALLAKTEDGGGTFANHPKKKERQDHIRAHVQSLKQPDGDFNGLATTGLRSPPLSPAFAAVRGGSSTRGVAKDRK